MERDQLNTVCRPLDEAARALALRFSQAGVHFTTGWYNSHYHKNTSGEYEKDSFPIPVISVVDLCDIEVGPERISVTAKLSRARALAYDYRRLAGHTFEVYGVEAYLTDCLIPGDALTALLKNLRASTEKEIGFSFSFPKETDPAEICAFTGFLRDEGFRS